MYREVSAVHKHMIIFIFIFTCLHGLRLFDPDFFKNLSNSIKFLLWTFTKIQKKCLKGQYSPNLSGAIKPHLLFINIPESNLSLKTFCYSKVNFKFLIQLFSFKGRLNILSLVLLWAASVALVLFWRALGLSLSSTNILKTLNSTKKLRNCLVMRRGIAWKARTSRPPRLPFGTFPIPAGMRKAATTEHCRYPSGKPPPTQPTPPTLYRCSNPPRHTQRPPIDVLVHHCSTPSLPLKSSLVVHPHICHASDVTLGDSLRQKVVVYASAAKSHVWFNIIIIVQYQTKLPYI